MKRLGGIYEKAAMRDALVVAHQQARKGKRSDHSCMEFERHAGTNINALHVELKSGAFRPRQLTRFMVNEPKPRLIEAPAYRDLVVQHAFYAELMPMFELRFVRNSFACRVGMGTHACADYVQKMMRAAPHGAWTLHIDVKKYFYSIDRDILQRILERHIKCQPTLRMLAMFAERDEPTGIPIGNLLSQLFALVYLNEADHFIKRDIGIERYARYMDDMVVIANTRTDAVDIAGAICAFLKEKLNLSTSKVHIAPVRRGINFCGFRTWRKTRVIRKRALRMATRAIRCGNRESFNSYLGHAMHTASHKSLMNYCQEHNHALYQTLPESHHAAHRAFAHPS